MFVCDEEAAIDGDPVVVCCRRDTFICCLLLCLFKNALEPTAETSIYICHTREGGGRHGALTSWVSIFAQAIEIDGMCLHVFLHWVSLFSALSLTMIQRG